MKGLKAILLHNRMVALATIVIAVFLLWALDHNQLFIDLTRSQKHSLTPATQKVLQNMAGPVSIRVFIAETAARRKSKNLPALKARIERRLAPYQRYKNDISIDFVNHAMQPLEAHRFGVKTTEAVVISYKQRHRQVRVLDESNITKTLLQLAYNRKLWIIFSEGHGEKTPYNKLEKFAHELKQRQAKVQTLNLAKTPVIPDNTSLLVIAAPKTPFGPQEVSALLRYINRGGNLLWLHDYGRSRGLELLAARLGISFLPGIVVEPAPGNRGPEVIFTDNYSGHATTSTLGNINAVFPVVTGIKIEHSKFSPVVLYQSGTQSWNETNLQDRKPKKFNPGTSEQKGPLPLAVALERQLNGQAGNKGSKNSRQRIVVTGDSDFMSDRYLNLSANKLLGMNLLNWLTHYDEMIAVNKPRFVDVGLGFTGTSILVQGSVFAVALPLSLAFFGILVYRRRQQQH